ncbi:MAG: SpoIIE family protein phosphatase [Chlorobi bacterium]|nr:SpoIIE family protein phosphatase [Chlorobiota bacterium]
MKKTFHISLFLILFFQFNNLQATSYIKLSEAQLKKETTLDGNWDFYWNQLLVPADIDSSHFQPQVVKIPDSWTNYKNSDNKSYPAYGYATYSINIKLDKEYDNLGLFIPMIWSANKIWINNKLVCERGIVGPKEVFKNFIVAKLIEIPPAKEIKIVVQVANFSLFIAGIPESFKVGYFKIVKHHFELHSIGSLMWIACVLLMAFYHILLYLFRKKNKSTLFFAIIAFLIFIKQVVYGDHYFYEYLKISGLLSFKWQSTLYYISTFMLVPIGLYYVESLYYKEVKRKIANFLFYITLAYSLYVLVTPPGLYTPTLTYFQVINFLGIGYLFYAILLATIRKRPETRLQFSGIIVMIFAGLNDALYSKGIELTPDHELIPLAFGIFLVLQFFIIAKRFATALTTEENLANNLEKKVKERTLELNNKNIEISQLYKDVTDSIHYAKRIQKTILPDERQISSVLPEYFIFYLPKDIISGDFYWFKKMEDYAIIAAVDCTGHGVPGALVSLVSSNLLNRAIEQNGITKPNEILEYLSKDYYKSSEVNSDGMDISILRIDLKNSIMEYAGAYNPLYWIRDGKLQENKADKKGIEIFKSSETTYTNHTINIKPNDCFYIFTDGFADQFGGNNDKKYLYSRFKKYLISIYHLPMNEQKAAIQNEFSNWKGDNFQVDDVLVIGIKF